MEEHLPLTVINDWNLTESDLSRYKVLVLANTACLTEPQVEAVRAFVKNGGGLVASGDASLYNEFGDRRENFALADVFGVDYRGTPGSKGTTEGLDPNFAVAVDAAYHAQRINIFDLRLPPDSPLGESPKWKSYVPSGSVTFKGRATRVALNSDQATIVGSMRLREEGADELPAAVIHPYGQGRVIYLAAGLDSAYYLYPYPYQRLLLNSAIRHVAAAPPGVRIDAPMWMQATVMRQHRDGQRLVVNLFNSINSSADHALPPDDIPLREEVVPVHDIKVTFGARYKVLKAFLQPENRELELHATEDGVEVHVPRLDIHGMVVAELAPE